MKGGEEGRRGREERKGGTMDASLWRRKMRSERRKIVRQ